jgi:hypothetical protein
VFRDLARHSNYKGETEHQSAAASLLREAGDIALVTRGVPRSVVILCPDGCGERITVNLDRRSGPAWRLYNTGGKLTLFPSVWRESGCKAHFILWNDVIYWSGLGNVELSNRAHLQKRVLESLNGILTPYSEIAAELDEIPWAVLLACRALARSEAVEEGKGPKQGFFRIRERRS